MEIQTVLDQADLQNALDSEERNDSLWMGRLVHAVNQENKIHSSQKIKQSEDRSLSVSLIKRTLQPLMSRICDESHAEISGGYDGNRGPYVEAKWTWEWNEKTEKEPSTENASQGNEGLERPDSPDFTDRDFEKAEQDN